MKTLGFSLAMALMCAGTAAALQVLYTAEGDTTGATDRLTADGAQNGAFTQLSGTVRSVTTDVYVTNSYSRFGTDAFGFNKTASCLNTIDMQGATNLGSAFTLAAFVRPNVAPSIMRVFSTFTGAGATTSQLVFDYGSTPSLRLIVNNTTLMASPAVNIPANAYSHLAATYDNGAVKLYVNGKQVGSGTAGSGTPVINNNDSRRIQVGEDWLTPGNNGDQSMGLMDDILIYDRALSSNEVGRLTIASASECLLQDGILFTAEGDTVKATDGLTQSLAQEGVFATAGVTVSAANPKFGTQAFNFMDLDGSDTERDVLRLLDSKLLGERFTLAAHVDTATNRQQRLFSSFLGYGSTGGDSLYFDFDPDAASGNLRFGFSNVVTSANATFNDGAYHHLAMTYDNGAVKLYLDGAQVGSGLHGAGAVTMLRDLQVGEDWGTSVNEQLVGDVDDILFYTNTLSMGEVRQFAFRGAEAYFSGTLSRPGIVYTAEQDVSGASDKLPGDGAQNGVFASVGVTVSKDNPKFGLRAFNFSNTVTNEVHDVILMPGSRSLGERFTLAAYVDTTALSSFQRLFSNYSGGIPGATTLLLDFDPSGASGFTVRFYHSSTTTVATATFNDGAYHHLAATYDNGAVKLYLDGTQVGSGTNGTGGVTMTHDLRIGEDVGTFGNNEQLLGDVDDIVVLFEALGPADIATLKTVGAQIFLGIQDPPPKGTLIRLN